MFKKPFSFNGRIRRTEYGISSIIYIVCATILNDIIESSPEEMAILGIAHIPLVWFLWAQGAKRCHDLGNSGWWQVIPFYGFWLIFQDGQRYTNEYGLNPKGVDEGSADFFGQSNGNPVTIHEKVHQEIQEENYTVSSTLLEVQNASYSNLQDIIKRLRTIDKVHKLSYEYIGTAGDVKISHQGSSQELLEEFDSILPNNDVLGVSDGKIIIRLK